MQTNFFGPIYASCTFHLICRVWVFATYARLFHT